MTHRDKVQAQHSAQREVKQAAPGFRELRLPAS